MDVRKEKGEEERKGRLIVPALALAEHIDEVTLPTRPSYAKWTLQTGRPLNLICTSEQLPAKPRPDGSAESLFGTSTPVCLFTDRFPSRISFLSRTLTPVCRYILLECHGVYTLGFFGSLRVGKTRSNFDWKRHSPRFYAMNFIWRFRIESRNIKFDRVFLCAS